MVQLEAQKFIYIFHFERKIDPRSCQVKLTIASIPYQGSSQIFIPNTKINCPEHFCFSQIEKLRASSGTRTEYFMNMEKETHGV